MYFPLKDQNDIFRIGVAISDNPEGPFIPQANPMKGSYSIDPAILDNGDGDFYMYFGGLWGGQLQRYRDNKALECAALPEGNEQALPARVAKLSKDMLEFAEEPKAVVILDENGKPLTGGDNERRFFEASWMHKYNGKYYIGGVHTNGDFYISDDLVHWGKPVHVVSIDNDWIRDSKVGNDQIHANHMLYDNGTFHLYWSVNYWGKDKHAVHIVHAQSDSILGPYIEPVKATWMDNRIDPYIFKDDDGQLYMYMVRFTDGNTIWGRKMKNPSEFSGEPVFLFSSLPDT
jgi:beta-xylosidase